MMNFKKFQSGWRPAGLACAAALLLHSSVRAAADTATATTNAPVATIQIKSVFDDTLTGGKDPFFPFSVRRAEKETPQENEATPPPITVALVLKGFSGTPANRLAIINDHTFAAGEEREVATPTGRMTIRCLEIKDNSVTVLVGNSGQRVELKLPSRQQ